jgi:hypothetical protein
MGGKVALTVYKKATTVMHSSLHDISPSSPPGCLWRPSYLDSGLYCTAILAMLGSLVANVSVL